MKISAKSRYSLKILLQIAMCADERGTVKGRVIAKKQKISEVYFEQIMSQLRRAGLVTTVRGCNGGYVLNHSPKDITLLDIIELFEGKIEFVEKIKKNVKQNQLDLCPTTKVWQRLSDTLTKEAVKVNLASIIREVNKSDRKGFVI